MTNFFLEELRKIYGDGRVIHDPQFVGECCYGSLGDLRVKARFTKDIVANEHSGDGLEALLQSPNVCGLWSAAGLGTGDFRQRTARQRRWICRAERGRSPSTGAAKGVDCLIYGACCPVGCRLVADFVAAKVGV